MKEIDNNEKKIDTPTSPEAPESAKETERKKAEFGSSLDAASSTGNIKNKEGTTIPTEDKENKEAKTDHAKVSEVKNNQKTPEVKKEEFGSKLDNLSSTGKERESGNPEQERLERINGVKEITQPYYDKAKELAKGSEKGANFTDHNEDHVEQVAEKTLECANALEKGIEKGKFLIEKDDKDFIKFAGNIDMDALEGAALSHDIGMCGEGYSVKTYTDEDGRIQFEKDKDGNIIVEKVDPDNFDNVRDNHSLNSAITILANRDKYKELGYTDEQVDTMAVECMAHSKSHSGVQDLNSRRDWGNCFDCMDAVVDRYNQDHPDAKISKIDRARYEENDEKLGQLATSTQALRVGDVSRNSGPDAKSQSGDEVHVDRETLMNEAGTPAGEVENADIKRGDVDVVNEKSRTIHAGEQNITDNHTICTEDGTICHEITVNDANSAPECTIDALEDHIKEFATGTGGEYTIEVKFDKPCSPETEQNYKYLQSNVSAAFKNIHLIFPWDKKEDS